MEIIEQDFEILDNFNGEEVLKKLELCGRVCYKSENKITEDSARKFISNIIKRGHESVLEHFSFSVRFITDRGISHEIIRHRLASYSQESTRYCKYRDNIQFVAPLNLDHEFMWKFREFCECAEEYYKSLLEDGVAPQVARDVLPTALKTELIMTANLREWRHFLKMRTSKAAHPKIRSLCGALLQELQVLIPVVFDDIFYSEC